MEWQCVRVARAQWTPEPHAWLHGYFCLSLETPQLSCLRFPGSRIDLYSVYTACRQEGEKRKVAQAFPELQTGLHSPMVPDTAVPVPDPSCAALPLHVGKGCAYRTVHP